MFSVIVVNYCSGDRLARCLKHLSNQTDDCFETIVIDNASTDNSLFRAQAAGLPFQLIELSENTGFAAANNTAAKNASAQWLVFLNPDAYPFPDWIAALKVAVRSYPDTDAFGSMQQDDRNPGILDGAGDVYHAFGLPYRGHHGWPTAKAPPEGECFAPCAAAAVYRRKKFEALGGFEESFFCYGEDVDLGFRLRLAGGHSIQLTNARVLHEGSAVTGRRSDFTIYHGHRNRIWTFFRNMPLPMLILLLPFHMAVNLVLMVWFVIKQEAPPYLKALADGFGGLGKVMDDRRRIQNSRQTSIFSIARALTWSPFKAIQREADIRNAP